MANRHPTTRSCIFPWMIRVLGLLIFACSLVSTCTCACANAALAELSVGADSEPVLSVSPIPNTAKPSIGTPQVTWSTGNGSPGNVTVTINGTKETLFAYGVEGTSPAPWLSTGNTYILRLYSIAPRRRLLARLRIDKTATFTVVGQPVAPPVTSPALDRVLQLISFGWIAVVALLASMYVMKVRHDH